MVNKQNYVSINSCTIGDNVCVCEWCLFVFMCVCVCVYVALYNNMIGRYSTKVYKGY